MPTSRQTTETSNLESTGIWEAYSSTLFIKALATLNLDNQNVLHYDVAMEELLKYIQKYSPPSKSKGHWPQMRTVTGGVLEYCQHGGIDAALETEEGDRVVLRQAHYIDLQTVPSNVTVTGPELDEPTPTELISRLRVAGSAADPHLICQIELADFDVSQRAVVLPLLWQYIIDYRKSNNIDELVAAASAIRKYIAIMPMDQLGKLSEILAPGSHEPLPLELELEVAKMIYRNFELFPPAAIDPQPQLASRLWEMAQAYINPRILLRDKHSAVASLAIEALVAMRSSISYEAWHAAINCQHHWFGEMVTDDLHDLGERWAPKSAVATKWLSELRSRVIGTGKPDSAKQP